MWAKIITINRTKDLNYFSLCAFNLFNTRVSQFEFNYWIKWTFPRHSNLLTCTCMYSYWKCFVRVFQFGTCVSNKYSIVLTTAWVELHWKLHTSLLWIVFSQAFSESFRCSLLNIRRACSDGEVKRCESVKLSTQLYRKKVHYSKLFKTCLCCGHLVVLKMNKTFQSAVIHYSYWFHIWFYYWFLILIYFITIMAIVKVIHLCRCTAQGRRLWGGGGWGNPPNKQN